MRDHWQILEDILLETIGDDPEDEEEQIAENVLNNILDLMERIKRGDYDD